MKPDVKDLHGRPLKSLRISVTDRCNLRCQYCMPEKEYVWMPKEQILSFEEIGRVADLFLRAGVTKFRLTGGEPLLRKDLPQLVEMLARRPGLEDLALTTNGMLLKNFAPTLFSAGLHRLTISLDTLRPTMFHKLTGRDALLEVLAGIDAAKTAGFRQIKLNMVVLRGKNDDELIPMLEFARERECEVRFIEYMDVGGATRWSTHQVVSKEEILQSLSRRYGKITPIRKNASAPADEFALSDGTTFGVISSTTQPFCKDCDRSRLTADGQWLLCLYALSGIDIRGMLRSRIDDSELENVIRFAWSRRTDRGAEDRLHTLARGPLLPLFRLREDPHLEMHTRGG